MANRKPIGHIYAFAFSWLFLAFLELPITDVYDFIVYFWFALFVAVVVYLICSWNIRKMAFLHTDVNKPVRPHPASNAANKPQGPAIEKTGDKKLDDVIREGLTMLDELKKAGQVLKNSEVSRKVNEMADLSYNIIEKLKRQPQLFSSVQRFFNYYLPTTTKLITNYSYMELQGVKGGNISETMQKIESSLDDLINAYRAQLDKLFSHTAMDLETDIEALQQVLKQEGLMENEFKGDKLK